MRHFSEFLVVVAVLMGVGYFVQDSGVAQKLFKQGGVKEVSALTRATTSDDGAPGGRFVPDPKVFDKMPETSSDLFLKNNAAELALTSIKVFDMKKLPASSTFPVPMQSSVDALNNPLVNYWSSAMGTDGIRVNCGGIDLYEVYKKTSVSDDVQVSQDMVGNRKNLMKVGGLLLSFKSSENLNAYAALLAKGQAVPAFGCWCVYGLAHPTTVHLAASNKAYAHLVATKQADGSVKSGLYFNLYQREASYQIDPKACVNKAGREWAKIVANRDAEVKRGADGMFDETVGGPKVLSPLACKDN